MRDTLLNFYSTFIQFLSNFYPTFIQLLSNFFNFYPTFIQFLFNFYPTFLIFIQFLSNFYPTLIQLLSNFFSWLSDSNITRDAHGRYWFVSYAILPAKDTPGYNLITKCHKIIIDMISEYPSFTNLEAIVVLSAWKKC